MQRALVSFMLFVLISTWGFALNSNHCSLLFTPQRLLETREISSHEYFRESYLEARQLFLASIKNLEEKNFELTHSVLEHPKYPELVTDVALVGNVNAEKVVIVISGLHGVEGYTGSAIQNRLLKNLQQPGHNQAYIFIHAFNPYGMALKRRTTDENIDLNRGGLLKPSDFEISDSPETIAAHAKIREKEHYNSFFTMLNIYWHIWNTGKQAAQDPKPGFTLNPKTQLKRAKDNFMRGAPSFMMALLIGQYSDPNSLFYGGRKLSPEYENIFSYFKDLNFLPHAKEIYVQDVHTGLGARGEQTLISLASSPDVKAEKEAALPLLLQNDLRENKPGYSSVPHNPRGVLFDFMRDLFPDKDVYFVAQEFGTYHVFHVLKTMLAENRTRYIQGDINDEKTKAALMEAFNPAGTLKRETENQISWRQNVLQNGQELFNALIAQ